MRLCTRGGSNGDHTALSATLRALSSPTNRCTDGKCKYDAIVSTGSHETATRGRRTTNDAVSHGNPIIDLRAASDKFKRLNRIWLAAERRLGSPSAQRQRSGVHSRTHRGGTLKSNLCNRAHTLRWRSVSDPGASDVCARKAGGTFRPGPAPLQCKYDGRTERDMYT